VTDRAPEYPADPPWRLSRSQTDLILRERRVLLLALPHTPALEMDSALLFDQPGGSGRALAESRLSLPPEIAIAQAEFGHVWIRPGRAGDADRLPTLLGSVALAPWPDQFGEPGRPPWIDSFCYQAPALLVVVHARADVLLQSRIPDSVQWPGGLLPERWRGSPRDAATEKKSPAPDKGAAP
jgi:hypothetical protein